MAITYSWEFPSMDVAPSADGKTNVVRVVHWNLIATDGTRYENTPGFSSLAPPKGSFVNYADLTPQIVTGWVEGAIGADELAKMKADLADRIARAIKPVIEQLSPPWAA